MNNLSRIGRSLARVKFPSLSNSSVVLGNKTFHISSVCRLKEIREEEKNGEIIIKGVYVKSPREDHLLQTPGTKAQGECTDCPICKLGSGIHVKHTDVLILNQFVSLDGRQLPRNVTGLCKYQHKRMEYLILMSRHAGLLPKRLTDGTIDPRDSEGWKANNKYYDDDGIDDFFDTNRKKL